MSGTEVGPDLAAATSEFLDGHYDRVNQVRSASRAFARSLAVRMSDGEEFDVDTFLFAVSMGKPEEYEDEKRMLLRAQGLERGSVVAVASLGKICCVGTVCEDPLKMIAKVDYISRSDYHDHHNRRFNASLLFTRLSPTSDGKPATAYAPGVHKSGVEAAPHAMTLLGSYGEPDSFDRGSAFSVSNELIVGSKGIIDALIDNPETPAKIQVYNFIEQLAAEAEASSLATL